MQGKQLTEGELKSLKDGDKVHLVYTHPNPDENTHDGVAFVRKIKGGCMLHVGSKNSMFCMDWTYGEYGRKDDDLCISEGSDGDTLELYQHVTSTKKKR